MELSPKTLGVICSEFVIDNFEEVFTFNGSQSQQAGKRNLNKRLKLTLSESDFYIPSFVAESLITALSLKRKLNNNTIGIFRSEHTSLRKVVLPHYCDLSKTALQVFKDHNIVEFEIWKAEPFNKLIQGLPQKNHERLVKLTISFTDISNLLLFVNHVYPPSLQINLPSIKEIITSDPERNYICFLIKKLDTYLRSNFLSVFNFIQFLSRDTLNVKIPSRTLVLEGIFTFFEGSHEKWKDRPFKSFRNLRYCNFSGANFSTAHLEILIQDCNLLEVINISATIVDDISCLSHVRNSLKTLKMYKLKLETETLMALKKLETLDISTDNETLIESDGMMNDPTHAIKHLLSHPGALPSIISLDLSGRGGIDFELVRDFISNHPKLRFLGLFYLDSICREPSFCSDNNHLYNPSLKVTGIGTKDQITNALNQYQLRPLYIQYCIEHVLSEGNDFIMKTEDKLRFAHSILSIIKYDLQDFSLHLVRMISVNLFFNLTKHNLTRLFHPNIRIEIVNFCLDLMEKHSTDIYINRGALYILSSSEMLEELVGINELRYCKIALNAMVAIKHEGIIKMAIIIAGCLATRMTLEENKKIGSNKKYMKKFLSIIKTRLKNFTVDVAFKTTMTVLWNLSDESPETCRVFIEQKGLELFESALDVHSGDDLIETDIIGILSNIAEVKSLRKHLMKPILIRRLCTFLNSDELDLSFYAADILAHLASDGDDSWTSDVISRADVLKDLYFVISYRWQTPGHEIASYRSFTPYIYLLKCTEPAVQLFGLWAITHVCKENPERYLSLLKEEELSTCLDVLSSSSHVQRPIKTLVDELNKLRSPLL